MDGFSAHFESHAIIFQDVHDFADVAVVSSGLTVSEGPGTLRECPEGPGTLRECVSLMLLPEGPRTLRDCLEGPGTV